MFARGKKIVEMARAPSFNNEKSKENCNATNPYPNVIILRNDDLALSSSTDEHSDSIMAKEANSSEVSVKSSPLNLQNSEQADFSVLPNSVSVEFTLKNTDQAESVEAEASDDEDPQNVASKTDIHSFETDQLNKLLEAEASKSMPTTHFYSELSSTRMKLQRLDSVEQTQKIDNSQSSDTDTSSIFDDTSGDPNYSSSSSSEEESESEDTGNENVSEKKSKKRKKNPLRWKKQKAKTLRNLGLEYVSSGKSKKKIPAREMRPPCKESCFYKCSSKLSENERRAIFQKYWSTGSLERQWNFLFSSIKPLENKYRRIKLNRTEPRRQNSAFYLPSGETDIRVCKTYFLNTLGISERQVRTVIAKTEQGFLKEGDKRGKHGKHKKLSEEVKNSVREHIESIQRIESHYLRANTTREYIEGDLTISELHRMYKEECKSKNLEAASYAMYAQIFNTEYNISFFKPKKDLCDMCESYKNAQGQEREKMEEMYQTHLEEKDLSREEKKRDKESSENVILATYDLQAVLPSPVGQSSVFYYKSKLNSYNFTITELKRDNTQCYFWHEGEGNRGSSEIGTCVLKFLQEISANIRGNDELPEVIFYSDNCGGQQKNKFIIAMYIYAVKNLNIKTITHKFLIRGHTQNEGYCVHSVIEKSISRAKKAGPIYIPDQYVALIRSAKKTGRPYNVIEMSNQDFYNLKKLADETGNNYNMNTDGETIKFNDIKQLKFEKENDKTFFYKTSYKEEQWKSVLVRKETTKTRARKSCDIDIGLSKAYSGIIPLSDNKKKRYTISFEYEYNTKILRKVL